ncbi:hypothetical protein HY637_03225 [Candidatus Woesearchaeota archaeon]|nr:hypothetical protein [Candidatus Woesearchaeota archaeon]
MLKYKKGGMGVIASVILIVVVFFFFGPFVKDLGAIMLQGGEKSKCSLSLILGTESKCPPKQIIILRDKVEADGKKYLDKGEYDTQTMAKEALAKLLVECKQSSSSFSRENLVFDEVVCYECFKVRVSQEAGTLSDLTPYLRDAKPKGINIDKTYLNILTRDPEHLRAYMEFGMAKGLSPSATTFTFKPGQDYTIFFMGIKQGEATNIFNSIKDVVTVDFLSFVRGNDAYFTYVAESDKISQICNRKVN